MSRLTSDEGKKQSGGLGISAEKAADIRAQARCIAFCTILQLAIKQDHLTHIAGRCLEGREGPQCQCQCQATTPAEDDASGACPGYPPATTEATAEPSWF